MTTFHSRQSDRAATCPQKGKRQHVQIHVTNCTTKLHGHVHEARKIQCNNVQGTVQAHIIELSFYSRTSLTPCPNKDSAARSNLAAGRAESRETATRWPRNIRQDIRRNFSPQIRAMSRQWPGSGNGNAAECPAGRLARQLRCAGYTCDVRRKLARQLATRSPCQPRNSQTTSRKTTCSNLNHDIQKL